jgi:predicted protein tyrosine phosphatase
MNSFRTLFGFNSQLIQYLRMNPLNLIVPATDDEGGIYLGNLYAAYNLDILKKHNISAVLTVAAGTGLKYTDPSISHMVIMADDIEHYNLSRHFDKMIDFIDKVRKVEKKSILIHCFAGISRSATTVIAYLMKNNAWTYKKASGFVREKRKEIFPNNGFIR